MNEPRAVRIFRRVLRLTSAEFRTHEGAGVVRLFAELHRDAVARAGWRGGISVLLAELPGLVRLAWITRRAAWQAAPLLDHGHRKDSMLETLMRDLRSAVRALRRAPGLVTVTILTLALGVGANTAIFSLVHGILLKPLAFPAPERLVALGEGRTDGPPEMLNGTSPGSFFDWRESARSASGIARRRTAASTAATLGDVRSLQLHLIPSKASCRDGERHRLDARVPLILIVADDLPNRHTVGAECPDIDPQVGRRVCGESL